MEIKNYVLLDGEHYVEILQESSYQILYIGEPSSVIKTKLVFVHKKPNLKSRINIKTITFNKSSLDLEVIVKIEKGAILTDTYLKIESLVVGDNSYTRAIPSLEIHESEVKGGHGATIGYIDENQLNYLYSKGLSNRISERLIIDAFKQFN